ncbi:hypothetical protein V8C34DRAFT_245573 [Trichoderma compactum]
MSNRIRACPARQGSTLVRFQSRALLARICMDGCYRHAGSSANVFAAQAHACAETLAGETMSEPLDNTMVRPQTWDQGRNRHDVCRSSGLFRHAEIAHTPESASLGDRLRNAFRFSPCHLPPYLVPAPATFTASETQAAPGRERSLGPPWVCLLTRRCTMVEHRSRHSDRNLCLPVPWNSYSPHWSIDFPLRDRHRYHLADTGTRTKP